MKIQNKEPYFNAAEERYVIRGCGDEHRVFGMLSPKAWETAQDVFNRNLNDLPDGWLHNELVPPIPPPAWKPEPPANIGFTQGQQTPPILAAVAGLMVGLVIGLIAGMGTCSQPAPAAPVKPTVLHIGGSPPVIRDGPIVLVDEASGHQFSAPAGSTLALPHLE